MSKINPENLRKGDAFTMDGTHYASGKVLYFESMAGPFIYASYSFETAAKPTGKDDTSISFRKGEAKTFHRVTKTSIPSKMRIDRFHRPATKHPQDVASILRNYRRVIEQASKARGKNDRDALNLALARQEVLESQIDKILS